MANNSRSFKCLFLILISFCVQCSFAEESKYNVYFSEFERLKNNLFSKSGQLLGKNSDLGQEKCLSDLTSIGEALLNKKKWAIKSKLVTKIRRISNIDVLVVFSCRCLG